MKKRLLIITLILCMLVSAVPAFGASFDSFADAKSHWAKATLERAVSENILNGSNGYLYPNGNLKGSEMSAIMVRQLDLQIYTDTYPGTEENDWFYRYAAIAAHAGIISSEEPLDMEAAMTREQVFDVFAKAYFTDAEFEQMLKKQEEEKSKAEAEALKKQEEENAKAESEVSETQKTDVSENSSDPESSVLSAEDSSADIDISETEETEKTEEPEKPMEFSDFVDADQLSVEGRAAAELLFDAGLVKGDDLRKLNPKSQITRAEFVTMLFRAADSRKAVVSDNGLKISIEAPDVEPGGVITAEASVNGVSGSRKCDISWYHEGKLQEDLSSADENITNETKSSFSKAIEFTYGMNCFQRVGFEIACTSPSGDTEYRYAEKVVTIENYPKTYYKEAVYQEALNTVSCVYKGNYTSAYNIDYSTEIKEAFVEAKKYSSKTDYLLWVNLATQKVNVFTGQKGDWQLIKTFRCASGAKSTPTPTGVTYVTYKQNGWYTDKYICKPVVRFYPGTGYAFHSVLLDPKGSGRIIDGSMGFPVSHGCIRMMPSDINWLHAAIPVNTTVVIY